MHGNYTTTFYEYSGLPVFDIIDNLSVLIF